MTKPYWTNSQIVDQLDSGSIWLGSNLTYGFPTSASWFPYAERNGFSPLTSAQQVAATLTIKLWDDLIAPDFALVSSGATANVKYMNTTTNIGYAQTYLPSTSQSGGSVWFNSQYGASSGTNNLVSPVVGDWGWSAYIHETGHSLGLNHPGNYNGGSPTYTNDALYAQDSQMFTIMSYFAASNTGADWIADDNRMHFAQTPMVDDVLAIQAMYGAETSTRTGNTVYGFDSNSDVWLYDFTQNQHPVLCIYDSGGIDTIDLSGWSYSCVLNLAPGSFSSCDMMSYNISIAYNVIIEDGIGGGGDDVLSGNSVGNELSGLAGNDTITGGAGNDTIDGGGGNDTAAYSGARTDYLVEWDSATNTFTLFDLRSGSPEGRDRDSNIENFLFSDGIVASSSLLIDSGAAGTTASGTPGADTLYGGAGNDILSGLAGNDVLVGLGGNDVGYGGDGNDYFYAGTGNDALFGGAGLDVLLGQSGNDSIYGGTGFNYLFGGDGSDLLVGSDGAGAGDVNVMLGEAGADALYGGAGTNYFYGGTGIDSMFGGSGLNIFISSGETDGNFIYGGSGQNYVYGSNGGDTVTGGTGVDVFRMGSGADFVTGGGGVDYAWGGGGSDTFTINDTTPEVMVIQDFNNGGVNDVLNFSGTSLHSFADVQAAEFYAAGINTTIITDAAGNAAWLIGLAPGQFDASMFRFG